MLRFTTRRSLLLFKESFLPAQHKKRFFVSKVEQLWPTKVVLRSDGKEVMVSFNNGKCFSYPAELLRVESPAARPQLQLSVRPKPVAGRRYVGILQIKKVGNYAIQIVFDDLHDKGIYSWPFLYQLGVEKYHRIRCYLISMKEHGFKRDPKRKD
eukprot:jgi/Botrbrau1/18596/Bobra.0367s0038.1